MADYPYPEGINVGVLYGVPKSGDIPGTSWSFDFPYSAIQTPKSEIWTEISVIQRTSNFSIVAPTLQNIKTVFGFIADWEFDFSGLLITVDVYENFAMAYNLQNTYDLFLTASKGATTYIKRPVIITSNAVNIIRGIGKNPAGAHGLKVSFQLVSMEDSITIRRVPLPADANINAYWNIF